MEVNMEYIKVSVKDLEDDEVDKKVFINGQENGVVGNVLIVDKGILEINVEGMKLPQAFEIKNTTQTNPRKIELDLSFGE